MKLNVQQRKSHPLFTETFKEIMTSAIKPTRFLWAAHCLRRLYKPNKWENNWNTHNIETESDPRKSWAYTNIVILAIYDNLGLKPYFAILKLILLVSMDSATMEWCKRILSQEPWIFNGFLQIYDRFLLSFCQVSVIFVKVPIIPIRTLYSMHKSRQFLFCGSFQGW